MNIVAARRATLFFLAIFSISTSIIFSGPVLSAQSYQIGVYYYPGWTDLAPGLIFPLPWDPIKAYPERKPRLGWYSDNDPAVIRQQAQWMHNYGIDYVVFDWYWDGKKTYLDQAVTTFKRVKTPGALKYSLLWDNHSKFSGGMPGFRQMVKSWIDIHFTDPDFLFIDGKPVVFVFAIDSFSENAASLGVSPRDLVGIADSMVRAAGFPGLFLVGGSPALDHWVLGVAPDAGFSAISAYNYHNGFSGSAKSAMPMAQGYSQFDDAYHMNWEWMVKHSGLPYIVPMTSGWDRRPWGRSKNPLHDKSISTLEEFKKHLNSAKFLMDSYPEKTLRMGVICCWNEFGEGSFIEPTERDGSSYLDVVRSVFSPSPSPPETVTIKNKGLLH